MRTIDADKFLRYLEDNICNRLCSNAQRKSHVCGCKYCYVTGIKKAIEDQVTVETGEVDG